MQLSENQKEALNSFEEALLSSIENESESGVPPSEVAYRAIQLFSRMTFEMAPTLEVARKTIEVSVEAGLETSELECCCE